MELIAAWASQKPRLSTRLDGRGFSLDMRIGMQSDISFCNRGRKSSMFTIVSTVEAEPLTFRITKP
jgi:hypothetical protein